MSLYFRAYSYGLVKSVLFRCHYKEDMKYPSYDKMSTHLNKTDHKVSFLGVRENVGSTSFSSANPTPDMQHSFGIPRYFFRVDLTSAISNQPYAYVHWAMFKLKTCHRTSFEGTMTNREWTTGPIERPHVNPFCYLEDVIPSRFALGFDLEDSVFHFMALDPERVGLENIEVPQVCDFGDNVLDYMTRRGHMKENVDDVDDVDDVDVDDVDDDDDECILNDNDDSDVSSASSEDTQVDETESIDYNGVLPKNFIDFLLLDLS